MFKSTFSSSNHLPDFPIHISILCLQKKDRGVKRAVAVRAESSLLDQAARDFTVTFYAESLGDTDFSEALMNRIQLYMLTPD